MVTFNLALADIADVILLIRDMVATDNLAVKPYIPHTKKYFYEFVANVLRDNIGILIFDLHGGC